MLPDGIVVQTRKPHHILFTSQHAHRRWYSQSRQTLAREIAEPTKELQATQQLLPVTQQQQLTEERQKTPSALASYEAANAGTLTELQTHRKAAKTYLASDNTPVK